MYASHFFKKAALVVILFFAITSGAQAQVIELWDSKGECKSNYDLNVGRLPKGSTLNLGNGKSVTIQGLLGRGNTTYIYDIGNGKAIRLPRGSGVSELNVSYQGYLTWFNTGFLKLAGTEAPIVKIFSEESDVSRYLIVENLSVAFTLEDLIYRKSELQPEMAAEATRALLEEFAPKTWQISFVSDMYSSQLFYSPRGWVIGDLTSTVYFAKNTASATLFSSMGQLPLNWRLKLEKSVKIAREEKLHHGSFLAHSVHNVIHCARILSGMVTSVNFVPAN